MRRLYRAIAGTYPSCQSWFLPVPPTLLRWHLSVSPTLLRSYPTGQVRRKESYRFAVSRNERLVLARSANDAGASTAAQLGRTKGTALFLPVRPTPHARLLLRSQVERKAASASHSGKTKGEGSPIRHQT